MLDRFEKHSLFPLLSRSKRKNLVLRRIFLLMISTMIVGMTQAAGSPLPGSGSGGSPVINSAQVNAPSPGSVTINGLNFGTPPAVKLAGSSLVVQAGATSTKVVATLPSGLAPGDYLLTVTGRNSHNNNNDRSR